MSKEEIIMDYEKKYKEALERTKKSFNMSNLAYSHEEIKAKLEYIFPELAESEDEKIRKEIHGFISEHLVSTSVEMPTDKILKSWISWLEKQGEQKPEWSEEDKSMMDNLMQHLKVAYSQCDWLDETINWLKSLSLKPRLDAVEKLYSNEWSDEDEKRLQQAITALEIYKGQHIARVE